MKKKLIAFGAIVICAFVIGVFFLRDGEDAGIEDEVILYQSEGCEECMEIETFIEENDIEGVSVKDAALDDADLAARAEICKIPASSLRTPFLWTGSDCLMGKDEIITHFEQEVVPTE